jgi:hypothetical protein
MRHFETAMGSRLTLELDWLRPIVVNVILDKVVFFFLFLG